MRMYGVLELQVALVLDTRRVVWVAWIFGVDLQIYFTEVGRCTIE
jgi:hypothetical protein